LVTVDAILEMEPGSVLLVERKYEPLGWALPGGFIESGEPLEAACRREVFEETGLEIEGLVQMHTYSDPGRDSRRRTITTVFVGRPRGSPRAGDDAREVGVFALDALPEAICFDHRQILEDFRTRRWGILSGAQ
jgi:8-oxo-dGTP diphosphatase